MESVICQYKGTETQGYSVSIKLQDGVEATKDRQPLTDKLAAERARQNSYKQRWRSRPGNRERVNEQERVRYHHKAEHRRIERERENGVPQAKRIPGKSKQQREKEQREAGKEALEKLQRAEMLQALSERQKQASRE